MGSVAARSSLPHTGTAHTGRPTQEIGCVSKPMLGRSGRRWPSISNHSLPIGVAAQGVAGASRMSKRSNTRATPSA